MAMEVVGNSSGVNYQPVQPIKAVDENYQMTIGAYSPIQQTAQSDITSEKGTTDGQKGTATEEQIKSAIKQANRRAHFGHTNAEFTYHEPTKRIAVKIIDKDTNEVIREIPPEETLEMISKMWELAGIMVDEKR